MTEQTKQEGQEIQKLLDLLAEFQAQRDLLEMERRRLIDEATPEEVRARIAEINAEINAQGEAAAEKIAALEKVIKAEVLKAGETIKGEVFSAIFMKGRVTWDAKIMDGFAVTHPEVLFARKEGEPSVSIRANK